MQVNPSSYDQGRQTASLLPEDLVALLPPGWPADVPLVRISTCGQLSIEVLNAVDYDACGGMTVVYEQPTMPRNGGTTALNLLKLLVSREGRLASKDWLVEKLYRVKLRKTMT